MTPRVEKIVSLAIIAGILLFFAWLSQYGTSHRAYLEQQRIIVVGHPFDAYAVWKAAGARGRELYLFDSRLNARKADDSVITPENYVYTAATGNIIREVHHVLPEVMWPKASAALGAKSSVAKRNGAYRFILESTPVIVTGLVNVAPSKEKALVIINTDAWDDRELGEIIDLVRSEQLLFDVLTVSGEKAEEALNSYGISYEKQ